MIVLNEENDDMPVCNTCLSRIESLPYRIVSLADHYDIPRVLHFHYFYPCWDLDLFFQRYVDHKIISLAFSCDVKTLEDPLIIRNMKNNADLWY
ncbi:hypothetical protein NKOR_02360 [Candidatus Nitrosopumilus koreensis AR1]|uniref:Uncharacterized protein n=1 Tax=Candidatus Nitrosopumilus koreensis AR1 TaxID=1229908 RepID=K0B610_9ARCH|nr:MULTISPECIES: hypothetical protein [Nitrosopumilus]AFS80370.1 hypothetical protein NKOR_02360 [Candidatus Nitrosopumilus koreensis AR1]